MQDNETFFHHVFESSLQMLSSILYSFAPAFARHLTMEYRLSAPIKDGENLFASIGTHTSSDLLREAGGPLNMKISD
jgi:hypothetical protein